MPVPRIKTWLKIGDNYFKLWNMPHCVGSESHTQTKTVEDSWQVIGSAHKTPPGDITNTN